jgi:hypothetical protein
LEQDRSVKPKAELTLHTDGAIPAIARLKRQNIATSTMPEAMVGYVTRGAETS